MKKLSISIALPLSLLLAGASTFSCSYARSSFFKHMQQLEDEMEALHNRLTSLSENMWENLWDESSEEKTKTDKQTRPYEIRDEQETLVLVIPLGTIDKNNIKIDVDNEVLNVILTQDDEKKQLTVARENVIQYSSHVRKQEQKEQKSGQSYIVYDHMARSSTELLPTRVDVNQIKATIKSASDTEQSNRELLVTLPKKSARSIVIAGE